MSLKLSKNYGFVLWSGKFCSGNSQKEKTKKEIPAKPGAVSFFMSAVVEKLFFAAFGQVSFEKKNKNQKKKPSCKSQVRLFVLMF